jgi:ribosomal protein S18 acetylase RimI-like enzyme
MMTVRPAHESDLGRLAQFWYERAALTPWPPGVKLAADAREQWQAAARGWLSDPAAVMRIADDATGQPAGFIAGRIIAGPPGYEPARVGEVLALALDSHAYHPGAGRALVEAWRGWLEERGVRRYRVTVLNGAVIEQAFWRSLHGEAWDETLWWTW